MVALLLLQADGRALRGASGAVLATGVLSLVHDPATAGAAGAAGADAAAAAAGSAHRQVLNG